MWLTEATFENHQSVQSEISLLTWLVTRDMNVDRLFLQSQMKQKRIQNLKNHIFNGLTHLRVSSGRGFKTFQSVMSQASNLQYLEIEKATNLVCASVPEIKPLKQLLSLKLKELELTKNSVAMLCSNLAHITELTISKCLRVTIKLLNQIMAQLTKLTKLTLSQNDTTNSESEMILMHHLANNSGSLNQLTVSTKGNQCFEWRADDSQHLTALQTASYAVLSNAENYPILNKMVIIDAGFHKLNCVIGATSANTNITSLTCQNIQSLCEHCLLLRILPLCKNYTHCLFSTVKCCNTEQVTMLAIFK